MAKIEKTPRLNKLEALENYLNEKYTFLNNTIANIIEFFPKEATNPVPRQVDVETLLHEVWRAVNPTITKARLEVLISSALLSKPINPLVRYLEGLEVVESDPFDDLVDLIEIDESDTKARLKDALLRWFVSAVRVIYDPFKSPKHMIVFQGETGIGKTPFLANFLPKHMYRYVKICPHLDPANKDSILDLARRALILFDEVDDFFKNKKNRDNFKVYATMHHIDVRAPYARVPEPRHRVASFLGSCNESTFLNDPTGSQRFVIFNVKKIWNRKALRKAGREDLRPAEEFNINRCWSWALKLYKDGFDPEYTIEALEQNEIQNERYKYNSPEFETMRDLILPAEKGDPGAQFMNATAIMTFLNSMQQEIKFDSVRVLGKCLIRMGFKRVHRYESGGVRYGYLVKKQNETTHGF